MVEKTIVKVLLHNKLKFEKTYTSYDNALDYAMSQVSVGYSVLILRRVNEKIWAKIRFDP